MMYNELGRRQEEGDQEDDKIREDLLYQQPLTPAANIQCHNVSLIASAASGVNRTITPDPIRTISGIIQGFGSGYALI